MAETVIKWDGTFLGDLEESSIIEKMVGPGKSDTFCKIKINGEMLWCILSKMKDYYAAIFDDCQEIFSLPKRQFHIIKINGIMFMIYKIPLSDNGNPVWEASIKYLRRGDSLRKDCEEKYIRRLLLVSEALTCKRISDAHVRIRNDNGEYHLVNYYSGTSSLLKNETYDYSCMTKKMSSYFYDYDIKKEARAVFNPKKENTTLLLHSYREKIRKIIIKHDKNMEWILEYIIGRIARLIG